MKQSPSTELMTNILLLQLACLGLIMPTKPLHANQASPWQPNFSMATKLLHAYQAPPCQPSLSMPTKPMLHLTGSKLVLLCWGQSVIYVWMCPYPIQLALAWRSFHQEMVPPVPEKWWRPRHKHCPCWFPPSYVRTRPPMTYKLACITHTHTHKEHKQSNILLDSPPPPHTLTCKQRKLTINRHTCTWTFIYCQYLHTRTQNIIEYVHIGIVYVNTECMFNVWYWMCKFICLRL